MTFVVRNCLLPGSLDESPKLLNDTTEYRTSVSLGEIAAILRA